jgi:hypothetical protein
VSYERALDIVIWVAASVIVLSVPFVLSVWTAYKAGDSNLSFVFWVGLSVFFACVGISLAIWFATNFK